MPKLTLLVTCFLFDGYNILDFLRGIAFANLISLFGILISSRCLALRKPPPKLLTFIECISNGLPLLGEDAIELGRYLVVSIVRRFREDVGLAARRIRRRRRHQAGSVVDHVVSIPVGRLSISGEDVLLSEHGR